MRFLRALVINPPNPAGYVSNKDSMGGFGQLYPAGAPPFPPLDIPYLGAFLLEKGLQVEVIEAGALHLTTDDVVERLKAADTASALVLVRTSLPTVDWDLEVCRALKARGAAPAVALFGPAVPSLVPRVSKEESLDFIVLGEPDVTVAELMAGEPLNGIAGLMYRADGAWRRNAERTFERNLDALPFPRWDLLPFDKYVIPRSSTSGRRRFLPMLTSRG